MRRIKPHVLVLGLFLVGLGLLGWAIFAGRPSARGQGPNPNPNPPEVAFSSSNYTASEADGSVTVTVVLSALSTQDVTVSCDSSDAEWLGIPHPLTITIPAGQISAWAIVPIEDNTCCEGNQTVSLTLSSPSGASLGSPSTATVTILDDDVCP